MNKITHLSLPLLIAFTSIPAIADSLESETTGSATNFSEGLSYSGTSSENPDFSLNAGYTFSTSKSEETGLTDKNHEVTAGLGWRDNWDIGGGLAYTSTPDEYLKNVGPNVYLGYVFRFGEAPKLAKIKAPKPKVQSKNDKDKDNEDDDDTASKFIPSVELKGKFTFLKYTESFTAAVQGPGKLGAQKTRTVSYDLQMGQEAMELSLNLSLLEWLSIDASYTKYQYANDLATFMSKLDSPRAVALGAGGFSSVLTGFADRAGSLSITVYPAESWELAAEGSTSRNALDFTVTKSGKVSVSKELFEHWKLGVGIGRDSSPTFKQNSGSLKLAYEF
jgi:hypothetical protein